MQEKVANLPRYSLCAAPSPCYSHPMSETSPETDKFKTMGFNPAEKKLWQCLEAGEWCVFDEKLLESERTLRGDILGAILRRDEIEGVKPLKKFRQALIRYAFVKGRLDMSDTKTELALNIQHSRFDTALYFDRAKFALLSFTGSIFDAGGSFNDIDTLSHLSFNDLKATGRLVFQRANVGGQLSMNKTDIANMNGEAIIAQGAIIKDGVFLNDAKILGQGDRNNIQTDGVFSAIGAEISNPRDIAIRADKAIIRGSVILDRAKFMGEAHLISTKISRQFSAVKTIFVNPNSTYNALNLQSAQIKGMTFLVGFPYPPIGHTACIDAKLGHVIIDANSYPFGKLRLQGATYRDIHNRPRSDKVAESKGWLNPMLELNWGKRRLKNYWEAYSPIKDFYKSHPEYSDLSEDHINALTIQAMEGLASHSLNQDRHPFAYRQFAKVLDTNGHEREARAVRIEAGRAYTKRSADTLQDWWGVFAVLTPFRARLYRVWRFVIKHLIGYGIKPWRIIPFMFLWWAIGSATFAWNYDNMTPARERFYLAGAEQSDPLTATYPEISPRDPLPKGYPDYSPIMYALDVMLPIVDFAQESHWRPKNVGPMRFNWLRNFNRLFLAVGWAFSTIAVLGFTGLISDKKEP